MTRARVFRFSATTLDVTESRDVEVGVAAVVGKADFTLRATSVQTSPQDGDEPVVEDPAVNDTTNKTTPANASTTTKETPT